MKYTLLAYIITVFFFSCGTTEKVISETTPVVVTKNEDEIEVEEEIEIDYEETYETNVIEKTDDEEEEVTSVVIKEAFNHSIWNALLQKYVTKEGNVNYEGFRQERGILREYIASLGAQIPAESWTKEDKLAYWMNAYNAMTVDLILRNLPLQSIKDIDKPWNQRLWKLGNKWYNLDEIEHQILRKMDEPRIHFGINCASFSCPPLLNEAFTRETVNNQLEGLAFTFINDKKRNTITSNTIEISKLFNWFSKDFKQNGSVIDYLNQYSEIKINSNARKRYKDYDWSLNN
ncbi:DUF547 domain-containing protein [Patiriisocius hiemis]|uniref:DUF547 domain-containing protein n=1 Tax=Patiriisocius hiemis TaxID=3075604 RepID=A0ABU2YET2_9FLAO|nr:DUF547 domain-containing protein [Constantimarinum sp. W242]MDT0556290.1 DUF547 domain-containing protein [Constantimarinum sp. W242]